MTRIQLPQDYKTFVFQTLLLQLVCIYHLAFSSTDIDSEPYRAKCSRRSNFDVIQKDHVLSDHVFASHSVTSRFECAVHCVSDTRCKSYNYQYAGTDCQLNNATKTGLATSLTSQTGYTYFEHNANTKVGPCRPNPCGKGSCIETCSGHIACDCKNNRFLKGLRCEEIASDLIHSSIMSQEPQSLLNTLVDFLDGKTGWTICWRGTRDGWAISTFHSYCNSKGTTVTIIKMGSYIFGGYSVIDWGSGSGYQTNSKTFIFSLRNFEGTSPFKAFPKLPNYHVYVYSPYGPTFGGGHDIKIGAHIVTSNFGHTYTAPVTMNNGATFLAGSSSFTPTEIEVFYETVN